jgi:hypothetical protein
MHDMFVHTATRIASVRDSPIDQLGSKAATELKWNGMEWMLECGFG